MSAIARIRLAAARPQLAVTRPRLAARPTGIMLRGIASSPAPKSNEHTSKISDLESRINGSHYGTILARTAADFRSHPKAKWAAAGPAGLLGWLYFLSGDDGSSDPVLGRSNPADVDILSRVPTSRVISGWIVYAFCSSPMLVGISEPLYNFARKIPIVGYIVDAFARRTFFRQFFGEETAEAAEKTVWTPLRAERIGVLTAYNVEADGYDAVNSREIIDDCVEGTLDAIAKLGAFGVRNSATSDVENGDTRCWVRTKVSGIIPDTKTMVRASEYVVSQRAGNVIWPGVPEDGDFTRLMNGDGLSAEDKRDVAELYDNLRKFAQQGQKYGVRIILDAEQSWYQPVVDVLTEELMREFNTGTTGPQVVCASFQAYLRRNTPLIESQMERAQRDGYKLIFKQVRGAYMPYERARWAEQGKPPPPPVWSTKAETDASYDTGMRLALEAIAKRAEDPTAPDVAVIFATHNEVSVDNAVQYLGRMGLGERQADGSFVISPFTANRLAFAQIYGETDNNGNRALTVGMKDNLTNRIAASIKTQNGLPVVAKSHAHAQSATYGTLENALPNISRRAAENKSVMEGRGGAVAERKRLARELCRRFIPFYNSDR